MAQSNYLTPSADCVSQSQYIICCIPYATAFSVLCTHNDGSDAERGGAMRGAITPPLAGSTGLCNVVTALKALGGAIVCTGVTATPTAIGGTTTAVTIGTPGAAACPFISRGVAS
jgi:hypothetical protein